MWVQMALVFLFGMLTAFIDIDSFFRTKRVGFAAADNSMFWLFLTLNGALSAVFLFWALSSPLDSPINKIIQVQSPWAKTVIIGFGVPLLIRSKLFSFGKEETPAGLALAYDWLRDKTLVSINVTSGAKKDRITNRYAGPLTGRSGLDTDIKGWVDAFVKPFASSAQQVELDAEFVRIQGVYTGANALSKNHIRQLIRWAMDSTDISYIEGKLKTL